jgi:hypothetical protein
VKRFRQSILVCAVALLSACASASTPVFVAAAEAYKAGDYPTAALLFREAALKRPSSGTLQNLGLSEWQRGQTGNAVLAWEQALWLDPFNDAARENLRFARKVAQLEALELAWYEVVSSWLPVNWWAWVAGVSLWGAVAAGFLPGILRLRKAVWQQALAAAGLAVFLLSVPAHFGVDSRSRIGYVVQKEAPLRLTPTEHGQLIARLPPGEPARLQRVRGRFFLIRTSSGQGWIEKNHFGLTCPKG